METLRIELTDSAFMTIHSDDGIAMELAEFFKFRVANYQYMPAFRNRMWDGYIRLFDMRRRRLYSGLIHYVRDFAKSRGYNIEMVDNEFGYGTQQKIDIDELMNALTITSKGKKIIPYDYQIESVIDALESKRKLLLSPTSSGKSLIIYIMIRYYLDMYDQNVLLCVPRIALVHQMFSDFEDYSEFDPFDVGASCHKIYGGQEKTGYAQRVTITTWQSIFKQPKDWFKQFGMVLGDEAHEFKAKSLTKLMEACTEAKYRVGTTGTLDDCETNQLVLEGVFGQVKKVIKTKTLMQQGKVAQLKINMLLLKWKDEYRKACAKLKYPEEIDLIVTHEQRNQFITRLVMDDKLKGNTLVLFQFVEKHGKPLCEMIREAAGDRKVFYVSGETAGTDREEIRGIVEKEADAIIVASFGTFSTGISIKRIHNLVFTSPSKSIIKILQSIGRVLRLSGDGIDATVYDISDDLSWKSKENYALKHAGVRHDIYKREGFSVEIHEIEF